MGGSGSAEGGMPLVADPKMRVVVKMMALYGPDVPTMEDVNMAKDIVDELIALARGGDGTA